MRPRMRRLNRVSLITTITSIFCLAILVGMVWAQIDNGDFDNLDGWTVTPAGKVIIVNGVDPGSNDKYAKIGPGAGDANNTINLKKEFNCDFDMPQKDKWCVVTFHMQWHPQANEGAEFRIYNHGNIVYKLTDVQPVVDWAQESFVLPGSNEHGTWYGCGLEQFTVQVKAKNNNIASWALVDYFTCECIVRDSSSSDYDGDGVDNDIDNCLYNYNPYQDDTDGDGIGDSCERVAAPALTEWGIAALAIIIFAAGIWVALKRRRQNITATG